MKTDVQLRGAILDEVMAEPTLRATALAVAVKGGIVTLSGEVPTYADVETVERAVQRVAGVRGYAQEIQVRLAESSERTDTDIVAAAVNALERDVSIPPDRIRVKVQDGGLTLKGTVEERYQREAAGNAVRHLAGVKWVNSQIVVKPAVVSADEVEQEIPEALIRNAQVDAERIAFSVTEGAVTLTGRVRSRAELEEAERAAWSVPGVALVDDRLSVR
jgi:osmotically-inducible protein OsmY